MFALKYSEEKNRIYIKINEVLSDVEFHTYKNTIMKLIDSAKIGFTVLADLSTCDSTILDNSDNFNVIREYGAKRGFKANALVLGRETYMKYNSGANSSSKNAFLTIDEAEGYLDAL